MGIPRKTDVVIVKRINAIITLIKFTARTPIRFIPLSKKRAANTQHTAVEKAANSPILIMEKAPYAVNEQLRLFARLVAGFVRDADLPLQGRVLHLEKDHVVDLLVHP